MPKFYYALEGGSVGEIEAPNGKIAKQKVEEFAGKGNVKRISKNRIEKWEKGQRFGEKQIHRWFR